MLQHYINYFKLNKFSKDVIWSFSSNIILAISGILTNVIVGNIYGASGLGIFNQVLAAFMMITLVADFGTSYSTLKYTPEYKEYLSEKNKILTSSFSITIVFSFLIIITIHVIYFLNNNFYFSYEATKGLRVISLSIPFFVFNRVILGYLNGLREMKLHSVFKSLRWIFIIISILLFSLFSKSIYTIFNAFLISEFILLLISGSFLINKYKYKFDFSFKWVKKNISFSYKTLLNSLISESNNKTDIFIASLFLTEAQLGLHSFAVSVARGLLMLPMVVMANFNPIISELYAKQQFEKLNEYIKKIKKTLLKINIPILLMSALLYPILIDIFMPKTFFATNILFYLMLIGVAVGSIYIFAASFLIMANKINYHLLLVVFLFVFSVIINFVLISYFDLIGAAISVSLYFLFLSFILKIFINKYTDVSI